MDTSTKPGGSFSHGKNTGDLALWWEVAREWRLGRQELCLMSRPVRPVRHGHVFLLGGDIFNPGYESSPFQPTISTIVTLTSNWPLMPSRHNQWRND
jgi:hypothetical protein